jgi:hypothetical protein
LIDDAEGSGRVPNGRDEILDRVRRGELSPEEAEAWARDNGQPPFAVEAGHAQFDPMAEEFWTLAMTAAWIIWRTPDVVRRRWRAYQRQCWVWRRYGLYRSCWEVGRPGPVTLFDVLDEAARQDQPGDRVPAADAVKQLWAHLEGGRLVATGIAHTQRRDLATRTPIPAYEWIDLSYFDIPRDSPDAIRCTITNRPKYDGVRVPRTMVTTLWGGDDAETPRTGAPDRSKKVRAQISKETHCKSITSLQAQILSIAHQQWPDGAIPGRVKDRNRQIRTAWPPSETPPHPRTIARAFMFWTK